MRILSGVGFSLLLLALLPASGSAATLDHQEDADDRTVFGEIYQYRGNLGERNRVRVSADRSGRIVFRDAGATRMVSRAPGCEVVARDTIRCAERTDLAGRGLSFTLLLNTGERDDRIRVVPSAFRWFDAFDLEGSAGDDLIAVISPPRGTPSITLRGSSGDDRLYLRGSADDANLLGGSGNDFLRKCSTDSAFLEGESGRDLLDSRFGGLDNVNCGGGRDASLLDRRDEVKRCERRTRRTR
jgi:hypothetical protein